jgi:hypothetical protein
LQWVTFELSVSVEVVGRCRNGILSWLEGIESDVAFESVVVPFFASQVSVVVSVLENVVANSFVERISSV